MQLYPENLASNMIARSTIEAELIALDTTCSEVEWLKDLISAFLIVLRPVPPISIHTDSKSSIGLLKQINVKKN